MKKHMSALLLFAMTGTLANCQIVQMPQNVATSVGGDVVLTCRLDAAATDTFIWDFNGINLWSNANGGDGVIDAHIHVDMVNKYDLYIRDVGATHAGTYECREIPGAPPNDHFKAEVVVFDDSECGSTSVPTGQNSTLTCAVAYWATSSNVAPPNVSFVDDMGMRMEGHLEIIQNPLSVNATYVFPVTWEDDHREFSCVVEMNDPVYHEKNCTINLDVKYPVNNITVSPNQSQFYVDDVINCTANGNPEADVMWQQLYPVNISQVEGGPLHVTVEMMGDNTWMCTAQNILEGENGWNLTSVSTNVTFKVVERDTSGATSTTLTFTSLLVIVLSLCAITL